MKHTRLTLDQKLVLYIQYYTAAIAGAACNQTLPTATIRSIAIDHAKMGVGGTEDFLELLEIEAEKAAAAP